MLCFEVVHSSVVILLDTMPGTTIKKLYCSGCLRTLDEIDFIRRGQSNKTCNICSETRAKRRSDAKQKAKTTVANHRSDSDFRNAILTPKPASVPTLLSTKRKRSIESTISMEPAPSKNKATIAGSASTVLTSQDACIAATTQSQRESGSRTAAPDHIPDGQSSCSYGGGSSMNELSQTQSQPGQSPLTSTCNVANMEVPVFDTLAFPQPVARDDAEVSQRTDETGTKPVSSRAVLSDRFDFLADTATTTPDLVISGDSSSSYSGESPLDALQSKFSPSTTVDSTTDTGPVAAHSSVFQLHGEPELALSFQEPVSKTSTTTEASAIEESSTSTSTK